MSAAKQYAEIDGVLFPVGSTTPRLKAGFYELARAMGGYGIKESNPVSDDLIDIPGTPADEVMADIAKFMETKDRYMRCGLTHKRGYLFHGPPGTGKTSLGQMLARRFIRDSDGVVVLIPNSGTLSIMTNILKEVEPGRPTMFIMEEADSFLNDVQALSILDGEHSLAGAVFVAMTNHKDRLPPRIANRPGRFDRVVYIGAPPRRVQVEYFNRLLLRLGEDHPGAAERMADAMEGLSISMGHLREAFIAHVLMEASVDEVRKRFGEMAITGDAVSTSAPKCPWCDEQTGFNGLSCECGYELDSDAEEAEGE